MHDILEADSLDEPVDFAAIDVSFISLKTYSSGS